MIKKVVLILVALIVVMTGLSIIFLLSSSSSIKKQIAEAEAEISARGETLNLSELAGPQIPDEENFAIAFNRAYDESFVKLKSDLLVNGGDLFHNGGSLTDEERLVLVKWVADNKEFIAKVRKALELSKSRFPVDYSDPILLTQPHLPRLRATSRLLLDASVASSETGLDLSVYEAFSAIRRLSDSIDSDSSLISWLVSTALDGMAFSLLSSKPGTLSELSDSELRLIVALKDDDNQGTFRTAIMAERCTGAYIFRLALNDPDKLMIYGPPFDETRQLSLPSFMRTQLFGRDYLAYLKYVEKYVAFSSCPLYQEINGERAADFISKDLSEESPSFGSLTLDLPTHFGTGFMEAGVREAKTRSLAVAASMILEHRGQGKALELIDPFDGKPLRKSIGENGMVKVWSVGKDLEDSGGIGYESEDDMDIKDVVIEFLLGDPDQGKSDLQPAYPAGAKKILSFPLEGRAGK